MRLLYVDTSALFKRCFDNDLRRAATAEGIETWPE